MHNDVAIKPGGLAPSLHQRHANQQVFGNFRRFKLARLVDVTGISGTGVVAVGVQFPDGHVHMQWVTGIPNITQALNMANLIAVHCHEGNSIIEWIDEEL